MRASVWLALLAGLLLVPLGIRTVELAGITPFEVGLPETIPSRVEITGFATQFPCGGGQLELRADHAYVGHEQILYFRLGPGTFVDLRNVVAEHRVGSHVRWRIRGPRARLAADTVTFSGNPLYRDAASPPRMARRVTVDLDSGSFQPK